MLSIAQRHTTPNSGVYTQPETGMEFKWDTSWQALLNRVANHRAGYNATLKSGDPLDADPNWDKRVEHDFCQQNPSVPCLKDGVPYGRFFTLEDLKRFVSTIKFWVMDGRPSVLQEEAERRAAICSSCPYNAKISQCFGCGQASEFLSLMQGNPTTSLDSQLHSCLVCGCALKGVKIFMPLGYAPQEGLEFPDFCWQRKD